MKCAYIISIQMLMAVMAWAKPPCDLPLQTLAQFESEPLLSVDYQGNFAVAVPRGGNTPAVIALKTGPVSTQVNPAPIVAIANSPTQIALSDWNGNIEVSSLNGQPPYQITPYQRITEQLSYSPSGNFLLAVEPGFATLHRASDGQTLRMLPGTGVMTAAFSPTTNHVATIGSDGKSKLWGMYDLRDSFYPKVPSSVMLDKGGPSLTAMSFAPKEPLFATGNLAGGVHVWDLKSKKLLAEGQSSPSPITALNFSNDGSRLLSTNQAGLGQVWNTGTGGSPIVIPAEAHGAMTAGFLIRNGQYALTAHQDGQVGIWELDSPVGGRRHAKLLYQYTGHNGPVVDLKMLPDSEFLTIGADGKVKKGTIPRIPLAR